MGAAERSHATPVHKLGCMEMEGTEQAVLLRGRSTQALEREPSWPASGRETQHSAAIWRLYASHALCTWGERAWEFAVGLIMLELNDGSSLLYVALFGLLDAAAQVVFGAAVGSYVDR